MPSVLDIVTHTPLWVWPLLALVVWLGWLGHAPRTLHPARLAVFATDTGRMVAALPCVQNADDVFFDAGHRRIYVPGGEGYISVFQRNGADRYELLARVPSALSKLVNTGDIFWR